MSTPFVSDQGSSSDPHLISSHEDRSDAFLDDTHEDLAHLPGQSLHTDTIDMEKNVSAALAAFHLQLPAISPRPASCVRPPCLKATNASTQNSSYAPHTNNAASSFNAQQQPISISSQYPSTSAPSSTAYSFSTPRCMTYTKRAAIKRQVHWDSSPPQAYHTHSAEDYDRSQIECTQGGSDFDLRLPSKCKRYNGDGEEDSEDEGSAGESNLRDDDDGDDASSTTSSTSASRSPPFMSHGSTGWAFLRKGAVIGALHSPRPPACKSSKDVSTEQKVSLPVHGVRTFGGLARRNSDDVQEAQEVLKDDNINDAADHDDDEELERDEEAVMEAAAIASMPTKSPNATPKPSPSIVPRWSRCTDYFQCASPSEEEEPLSSSCTTPHFEAPLESAQMGVSLSATSVSSNSSHDSSQTVVSSDVHLPVSNDLAQEVSTADLAVAASNSAEQSTHTGEQTPRVQQTAISSPEEDAAVKSSVDVVMTSASTSSSSSPSSGSRTSLPMQPSWSNDSAGRRPNLPRPSPFVSSSTSAGSLSPVYLSPSPSSEGSLLLSSLSAMQFAHGLNNVHAQINGKSIGGEHYGSISTPSPLSSRCSSVDPWSAFSSSGDEGTTGTSSPCAEWSSCTSPELTPAILGFGYGDAPNCHSNGKATPPSSMDTPPSPPEARPSPLTDATHQHFASEVDGDVSMGEGEHLLPAQAHCESVTKGVLNGAVPDTETGSSPRPACSRLHSEVISSERYEGASPPTTDEESPRRRSPSRPSSGSRRSMSLGDNGQSASMECRRVSSTSPRRRSSKSGSSSCGTRSSSLCMSMTAAEDGDDEVSPEPPVSRRSKSSSSSSSRSGRCSSSRDGASGSGKVKRMPVFRQDSFEDEGALGGF
ncbi:unnamed protein product [Sympodiomycopsis kandeliae]